MVRGRRQRWRAAVASQEMIYRLDRKQLTAQLCTISRTLELKSCKSSPEGESGLLYAHAYAFRNTYLMLLTSAREGTCPHD